MKKTLVGFIALLFLTLTVIPSTYAASSKIVIDGTTIVSDVAPETKNNRTMVPLRVISENLGVQVDWSNSIVTLTKDKLTVTLTIKNKNAVIDGTEVKLDAKPYLKNNRVYVPLRFISETFNSKIDYRNNIVTIDTAPLYIDGVKIKALQEDYRMTMGGVEQQITGHAYHQAIYQLFEHNKGNKVEAPAEYSWYSHPNSGSYYKTRQYNFLDVNGNSVKHFDIYSLVGSQYSEDLKDAPQFLLYDGNEDQWYLFDGVTIDAIWQLIDSASNNGFLNVISNTVA
jgi:hypothetical protein